MLFKGLAGTPAFAGNTLRELLASNLAGETRPLHSLRPGIPRRLRLLVAELLRQDPEQRPAASEVARRLAAMPAGEPAWDFERARRASAPGARRSSGRWIDTSDLRRPGAPESLRGDRSTPLG